MKAGFTGGLVVDYPNSTKAKKYFLCLFAGVGTGSKKPELPAALGEDNDEVLFTGQRYAINFIFF